MDSELDEQVPSESEQLDQLQPDDSLIDRGVSDVLDEGYVPPDNWSAGEGFGNTAAEMREGETLEMRMAQEVPDVSVDDDTTDWENERPAREVGATRTGRLVGAHGGYDGEDDVAEVFAEDVGIDGGAASAEEAAMHVIDDEDA